MRITTISLIFFLVFTNLLLAEELIVEIENPKFYEKSLDDNTFEIKASRGFKKEDDIELLLIEGKFKTDDGSWIYLTAENGKFIQSLGVIELENKIYIYSENEDSIRSDFAKVKIKEEILELSSNVQHKSPNRRIFADYSEIFGNFENITFKGNVVTKLNKNK